MLIGVQLAPEKDFSRYDRLIDLGVDHLSFCLEFWNPKYFAEICPGKEKMLGQKLFLDAMEYCAKRMPKGAVSGEIIAGIEPVEDTLAAIDYIADLGAFPTVCVFRPTVGADMESWPPPKYDEMRARHAARLRGLPEELDSHRRRAEHRGQPRREPRRRRAAGAERPRPSGPTRRTGGRRGSVAAPLFAWRRRARSRRVPGVGGGGATAGPASPRRFGGGLRRNPAVSIHVGSLAPSCVGSCR